MSASEQGFAKDVATSLLVLRIALFVFQYYTLSKFIFIPPGATFWELGYFVEVARREVSLGFVDAALLLFVLIPILYITLVETRARRLSGS